MSATPSPVPLSLAAHVNQTKDEIKHAPDWDPDDKEIRRAVSDCYTRS